MAIDNNLIRVVVAVALLLTYTIGRLLMTIDWSHRNFMIGYVAASVAVILLTPMLVALIAQLL